MRLGKPENPMRVRCIPRRGRLMASLSGPARKALYDAIRLLSSWMAGFYGHRPETSASQARRPGKRWWLPSGIRDSPCCHHAPRRSPSISPGRPLARHRDSPAADAAPRDRQLVWAATPHPARSTAHATSGCSGRWRTNSGSTTLGASTDADTPVGRLGRSRS